MNPHTSVLLRATRRFLSILRRFLRVFMRHIKAPRGTLCRASATSKILGSTLCRFFLLTGHPETRVRAQQERSFALLPSPLYKTLQNLRFGCENKNLLCKALLHLYENHYVTQKPKVLPFSWERLALHTFLARAPCIARST